MITQIYHKKNELFKVEFFEDAECTQAFDFMDKKDLYIKLLNGDCTPVLALSNKLWSLEIKANIFTPFWYLGFYDGISPQTPVITLNDVLCNDELQNVNLSKYIPEDNAVLFLSEEDKMRFYVNEFSQKVFSKTPLVSQYCIDKGDFPRNIVYGHFNDNNSSYTLNGKQKGVHPIYRKIKIFLPHGTHSELQKANEVAKELKEKYGVEEVNLFVLHWFLTDNWEYNLVYSIVCDEENAKGIWHGDKFGELVNNEIPKRVVFNEIITTNSTGILKAKDFRKRLQVIDCKEIFEEYLKENNL